MERSKIGGIGDALCADGEGCRVRYMLQGLKSPFYPYSESIGVPALKRLKAESELKASPLVLREVVRDQCFCSEAEVFNLLPDLWEGLMSVHSNAAFSSGNRRASCWLAFE